MELDVLLLELFVLLELLDLLELLELLDLLELLKLLISAGLELYSALVEAGALDTVELCEEL